MLPYKFGPFLFLRSPAYSTEAFDTEKLNDILADRFFRTALFFASSDLYEQVRSKDFDLTKLSTGVCESLSKYYNRMCFRATPFGMFSAFSSTKWVDEKLGLILTGKDQLHLQADFRLSKVIVENIPTEGLPISLYSNPSIYRLGKELRYLRSARSENTEASSQGIAAADQTAFLVRLIRMCREGITSQDLVGLLEDNFPDENTDELIEELKSEELLYSPLSPNVTGENYLKRIAKLSTNPEIHAWISTLESVQDPLDVNARKLEDLISPFASSEKIRSPFYVNYEKEVTGGVDERFQKTMMDGLYCLSRLQPGIDKNAISRFKRKFIERFEEKEVPLMLVLDPEAGIGYEDLEEIAEGGGILEGINFVRHEEHKQLAWGAVQEMLMAKISLSGGSGKIVIHDEDIRALPESKKPFAPGISMMFRICGDKAFIETAGGTTATALIGRFTSCSTEVLEQARSLAEEEQNANPDIIFAEIAHFNEEHAANINTREHIRRYEIPVLAYSTLTGNQAIGLNDLYVSVQRDEIVIRSARLQRRIVPRLSTAYNHVRSELPVFRFLSDLQYEGITSNFTIKFEQLIPGLTFYPRIEYKDCILSQASWIIKKVDLKKISDVQSFLGLARHLKLSRHFALSDADRQLVFDLEDIPGLSLLVSQIKNSDRVTLKEFFIEEPGKVLLKDKSGRGYIHQLIAFLINSSPSYYPSQIEGSKKEHTKRYIFPGEDWIYFKIYCSSLSANNILSGKIFPMLKKLAEKVDKWFFIRYYDPDHHLRIRIHGNEELIQEMPAIFYQLLKSFLKSGLISRLQIDTYVREIERYGPECIDQVEYVFRSSSELVAEYFRKGRTDVEIMQFALISVMEILESYDLSVKHGRELLEVICTNLIKEHGNEKGLRNDLNGKYREHQKMIQQLVSVRATFFNRAEQIKFRAMRAETARLKVELIKRNFKIEKSASDILHMHMNRIFFTEQRKKELVTYYMCLRFYISLLARRGL